MGGTKTSRNFFLWAIEPVECWNFWSSFRERFAKNSKRMRLRTISCSQPVSAWSIFAVSFFSPHSEVFDVFVAGLTSLFLAVCAIKRWYCVESLRVNNCACSKWGYVKRVLLLEFCSPVSTEMPFKTTSHDFSRKNCGKFLFISRWVIFKHLTARPTTTVNEIQVKSGLDTQTKPADKFYLRSTRSSNATDQMFHLLLAKVRALLPIDCPSQTLSCQCLLSWRQYWNEY